MRSIAYQQYFHSEITQIPLRAIPAPIDPPSTTVFKIEPNNDPNWTPNPIKRDFDRSDILILYIFVTQNIAPLN